MAPLVGASVALALLLESASSTAGIHRVVALLLLMGLLWAVAVRGLEGDEVAPEDTREDRTASRAHRFRGAAGAVLLGAVLLRLPLIFAEPALSTDVWRYLWDGRVVTTGQNPYSLAPDADELAPLRDALWERLDHRQVPTVYPPFALVPFSIAAATPLPLLAWKGLLTAAELAACALLLALARRRGQPPSRVAWYAWCPLAAVEVAGMGHVDGLAVAPMVAAVLWLTPGRAGMEGQGESHSPASARARPALAGLATAAGALVKLAPLAALGAWSRHARRPGRYWAVTLAVSMAGLLPVVAWTGGVPPGLTTYGVSWEFNGPLYEPLWRLLDMADADRAMARLADRAKEATGWHDAINRLYPFLYAQFLAKLLLAGGAVWIVAMTTLGRTWRARPTPPGEGLEEVTGRLFGGLLLCSATVYPWYLLWILPWAALTRRAPWLLAAALAPIVYLHSAPAVSTGPGIFPGLWLLAWGPPVLLAVLLAAYSQQTRRHRADATRLVQREEPGEDSL